MNEEIQGSNLESNEDFSSTENFFDALEAEVNSGIAESEKTGSKATPPKIQSPARATSEQKTEGATNDVNWEKRYKDSTREAQKLNTKLKEVEQYMPIMDAMKKDQGLVEHVRDYVTSGGRSKSVMDELKLDEDFVFDSQEAMSDPTSDSAKVFNAHVSKAVNTRVAKAQDVERRRGLQAQRKATMDVEASTFKKKHKMNDGDFDDMMKKAKTHRMSLEDLHFVINRDQANANIANSTKQEMLEQMKNVRDIPSSSAGINSAKVEKKLEDEVFDALKGADGDLEDLFGG